VLAGIVRNGTVRTGLLSAALAATALVICVLGASGHTWHEATRRPVVACALAVAFFLAEQNLISFEFRRQSHSMTFAGVPLALGVLLLPVPALVVVRVVGSLAAMIVQRTTVEKVAYNISAFAFEAALTSTLAKWIVPDLGPASVLTLVACVAAVDQLMTALVLVVIRFHGISMSRQDVVQVVVQSLVLSAAATTFAVVLQILLLHGITGYGLALALITVAVLGYRMYAGTLRRHRAMTTVHDFVTGGAASPSLSDVAASSLVRIRDIVRASRAELAVVDDEKSSGAPSWTVFAVDENDTLSVRSELQAPADWVRMRAFHSGIATLARRGEDVAVDGWLNTAGEGSSELDDAIVVPIHNGATRFGTLTVSGRLTDVATFTEEDVQVLQTLSGHLAASMQSARLLETLSYDATHDALTALANRGQLLADIAALGEEPASLLVFDIDHFKDVNDVFGHEVADELLAMIADRLRRLVPNARTVARVGGDEFAVLSCGESIDEDLLFRANSLAAELNRPLELHGTSVGVTVSVGIAATPPLSVGELLRCADTAMHAAKATTDHVALYSPVLDLGRAERIALAADLRLALEHSPEQFTVFFQPKVELHSGHAHGAEALVRWNHPSHGLITPDRFIPIAEATGLIVGLTRHVLDVALSECAAWQRHGVAADVSVNISARLLTEIDLVGVVTDALERADLAPRRLLLEITESMIMTDPTTAVAVLTELADLGVRISLDDFGTGYSSLSYLKQLPASELKIDRSFVVGMGSDRGRGSALLRNIVNLGLDLDMQLVAEGIETAVQAQALQELGCTLGQGYHFARPMSAEAFRSWLRDNGHSPLRLVSSA
jgi:diguanylate cyclase (GGDEF)-like protein